jgi:hypothetical protein
MKKQNLNFDKIFPEIPFGPHAQLLAPRERTFFQYDMIPHPVRQASYQVGRGVLKYLRIPFFETDIHQSEFGLLKCVPEQRYPHIVVCPAYFDFKFPTPKRFKENGFTETDWDEITRGVAGLTTIACTRLDNFQLHESSFPEKQGADLPKGTIILPDHGLGRFIPLNLIDVWYTNGVPQKVDIQTDDNRPIKMRAFPGELALNGSFYNLTEAQIEWDKKFRDSKGDCQLIRDLYKENKATLHDKVVARIKRKLASLEASPPHISQFTNLDSVREYQNSLIRYGKLESVVGSLR